MAQNSNWQKSGALINAQIEWANLLRLQFVERSNFSLENIISTQYKIAFYISCSAKNWENSLNHNNQLASQYILNYIFMEIDFVQIDRWQVEFIHGFTIYSFIISMKRLL